MRWRVEVWGRKVGRKKNGMSYLGQDDISAHLSGFRSVKHQIKSIKTYFWGKRFLWIIIQGILIINRIFFSKIKDSHSLFKPIGTPFENQTLIFSQKKLFKKKVKVIGLSELCIFFRVKHLCTSCYIKMRCLMI